MNAATRSRSKTPPQIHRNGVLADDESPVEVQLDCITQQRLEAIARQRGVNVDQLIHATVVEALKDPAFQARAMAEEAKRDALATIAAANPKSAPPSSRSGRELAIRVRETITDAAYSSALATVAERLIQDALPAENKLEELWSDVLGLAPAGSKARNQVERIFDALECYDEERLRFVELLKGTNRDALFAPSASPSRANVASKGLRRS